MYNNGCLISNCPFRAKYLKSSRIIGWNMNINMVSQPHFENILTVGDSLIAITVPIKAQGRYTILDAIRTQEVGSFPQ